MKKWLVIALALLLFCALCACGSIYSPKENEIALAGSQAQETDKGEQERYIFVGMHIILPYWQDHRNGFEAAAKELGVATKFTGEDGSDALRQAIIFAQAVRENPAGILVAPIDRQAMSGPINNAIARGIPVVCIDNDAPQSRRLTYFGTDNYSAGYLAAELLGKALEAQGDVGILTLPGLYKLDERQRGFEACIAEKYPAMTVCAVVNDKADPAAATAATKQLLEQYPDIKGLFAADEASGTGAMIALEQLGKSGAVKVVAMDKDAAVLELIGQGHAEAALVQRPFTMSYYGLKFLYDYNHNSALSNEGRSMLPDQVYTGITVVTKDNVGDFLQ